MTDHETNGAKPETPLESRIVSALEANCSALDADTRRRLDRIRFGALAGTPAQSPARRFFGPARIPMVVGAVAAAIALALAVVLIEQSPEPDPPPMTADLDLLTDPRFELFLEDPEFVAWIAEAEPEDPATENSG